MSVDKFTNKILLNHDFLEILRGASKSFLLKVIGLLFAQVFAFAVTRLLGAGAWGSFSLCLSVMAFGAILGSFGVDTAVLKLTAENTDLSRVGHLYKKSLCIVFVFSLLVTILVYAFSDEVASCIFSKPEMGGIFKISAFAILPMSLVQLNAQVLRGLQKIGYSVFLRFVARHFFSILFFINIVMFVDEDNKVLLAFIAASFSTLFLSYIWLRNSGVICLNRTIKNIDVPSVYSVLKTAIPLLFANSLNFVKGWIDTIMVGIFLTAAHVGVYNIALKLSMVLTIILTAVNTIVAPKIAEAYSQRDMDRLQRIVQDGTRLIFFLVLPGFVCMVVFATQLMGIFGSEFKIGSNVLIVLCVGSMVNSLSGAVGYFLLMTDSQVAFQNITLSTTVMGLLLNWILIPKFGVIGAGISTCCIQVVWNLSCIIYIRGKYKIKTYYIPFIS